MWLLVFTVRCLFDIICSLYFKSSVCFYEIKTIQVALLYAKNIYKYKEVIEKNRYPKKLLK